jgi:hypothetical protein
MKETFEVLKAMKIYIVSFWVTCSLVEGYWRFGGNCCFNFSETSVTTYQNCMLSYPRRPQRRSEDVIHDMSITAEQ